mmetsp:Transcript_59902/g.175069  ORF Transcript_59902/g.175069 Transcript_59902/m.175069 type:complete len:209 (+) Transcript_59902:719-1345(+)
MGENALHGLAAELAGHFGKGFRHGCVGLTDLHQADSSLRSVPRGHDDVCPLVLYGVLADDDGVCRSGDEAVDVAGHVHLGNVACLQLPGLPLQGGEVADQLVHRDARGEGNALFYLAALLLLVEKLAGLLLHDLVAHLAQRGYVGILHARLNHLLQGLVHDVTCGAVLRCHVRVAQVADLLVLGLVRHCECVCLGTPCYWPFNGAESA